MNIQEALSLGKTSLQALSSTFHLDTEVLLAHALGKTRSFVLAHSEYELTVQEQIFFHTYIDKRTNYVPVALIIGMKEFYGLDFKINENTFIPRPETELIVEYAINHCTSKPDNSFQVLDLGTGSGCIAISIGVHSKNTTIIACDINKNSLTIGEENAKQHKVDITFVESDFFSNIKGKFDIICANLPYVPEQIYQENKFLHHEPKIAITSGPDGINATLKVLSVLPDYLSSEGIALFEIHFTQAEPIEKHLSETQLKIKEILYDIQGFPRTLVVGYR